MNKRIKKVLEEMNLTDQIVFTLKDLETIAERAECPMIKVMQYLRTR